MLTKSVRLLVIKDILYKSNSMCVLLHKVERYIMIKSNEKRF